MALPTIGPKIKEADYEAFRRLMPDHLPATFQEWLQSVDDERAYRLRHDRALDEIEVDPRDFVAWCHRAGMQPDRVSLNHFAVAEAYGRKPNAE